MTPHTLPLLVRILIKNLIGIDFKIKNLTMDNKNVKLQIWDTAG